MKEKKTNILCSASDRASQNIKEHLIQNEQWEKLDKLPAGWDGLLSVYENPRYRIIEIKDHHIYQDRIDEKMISFGFDTDLIIVASKHKSKDGRSVLTAHFTGNPNDADFGGRPRELSIPATQIMSSILNNMDQMAENTCYSANMESTHHGPTDMRTAMVYAEIGSSEEQWIDPVAGDIVARAILKARPKNIPVAIGFGGGHYASRQTELILETDVTFGHNFPDYQLPYVDKDMIVQAYEKSKADFVYLDRKSMNSKERERLHGIIRELGYPHLRESEIKEIKGLPWNCFLKIKAISDELCPDGKFKITELFRSSFDKTYRPIENGKEVEFFTCNINEELLKETINADRNKTISVLNEYAPIYMEMKNGTISNCIMGIGKDTKTAMQNVTNECIKILKEHYEIKYIPDENILYIISNRFDPKAAKEFGIPPGPMLSELAKGNSVVVNGRTIESYMVHKRMIKEILLSY
ncbi:D-aminoacyl-tRNA deacylase [Methanolobus mangrovi]|uniref:D-aminoacyl-tRNA deacylase n=1 Tax=Methanolobus mangrovi TaxID=3072977 RepID=A0AA51UE35_9EURY|nr:D-aminoacyl-tRNA deacylase [Methanolobus mangrovi]WMW21522.1 D-aminoacyl-tRNA deacylase [Methanolobus mangrovi]